MSDDPFDSPEWKEMARAAREELSPMVESSAVAVSLYDGTIDPKMAIETGYMILLDKPIIAIVSPGAKVPNKLVLVADEIIEGNLGDPTLQDRLRAAIARVIDSADQEE